jgi:hypothetical protein
MSIKLTVARAQLGTALSLFIQDRDPISVHALACGGAEVMEGLAEQSGLETLSSHILATFPDMDFAKVKRLRNQYWNAIKHFYKADNSTAREDEALMADFSDRANDAVLFMGWLDYAQREARLPVEVQVFQVWWYATNESRMAPHVDPTPWRTIFPDIAGQDRKEQKRRLARVVEKYRRDKAILADPKTEPGRLLVRA